MIDYSVFDRFCKVPTWHTSHALDERRFNDALKLVIDNPEFSPESMGEYIRQNHSDPMWPTGSDALDLAICGLISKAWAVKDYLSASRA